MHSELDQSDLKRIITERIKTITEELKATLQIDDI